MRRSTLTGATDRNSATRRTVAAVLLVLAVVQYLVLEAVAAAGWVSPRYSYYDNFISDLGVTKPSVLQGRHLDSPLHIVASVAFIDLGVLVALAFVIIATTMARSGRTRAIGILGVVFGIGALIVASFPENTIFLVHAIGAFLNVWGGLAVVIVSGFSAGLLQIRRPIGVVMIVLGFFGFAASLALLLIPGFDTGATERTSGYSYFAGMIVLAIALLAQRVSNNRGDRRA